ncbi:MAG TPA: DUF3551 domain-containing protein [Pseudolabrys sp.]|nr:DUF3551 domain-containing protein [Pseudolabrys sp.]
MKHLIMAAVAVTVLCVNAQPAPAAGYAPWCAVSSMGRGGAYWDCSYATLDQCVPFIVAGNRGFCNPNPAYVAASEPRHWRRHHKRPRYD